MSLTVTPEVNRLDVAWTLPTGAYASIVKWREVGAPTWNQAVPPSATSTSIVNVRAVSVDVQVVLLPTGGVLSARSTPLAPAPLAPRVGVVNSSNIYWITGDPVAKTCLADNLGHDRIDVGDGSNLTLVDQALTKGIRPVVLYNPGTDQSGGLNNRTPVQVATEVSALAKAMQTRGLTELEVGNEPWWNGDTAASYAAKYAAARAACVGTNVRCIAMITGDYSPDAGKTWSKDSAKGGWLRDFFNALPSGASIDAISCHPYPPGSVVTAVNAEDSGWPSVGKWHAIATSLGINVPWYVTEIGLKVSESGGQTQQAAGLSQIVRSLTVADPAIAGTPYTFIRFLTVYTALDEGTQDWGVFNADGSPRPALVAIKQ